MKTLIKKILKEEMDDLQWMKDVKPMGVLDDLEIGDFVTPTCVKPNTYLVTHIFSVGLLLDNGLYVLQKQVELEGVNKIIGDPGFGILLKQYTLTGDNCRFEIKGKNFKFDGDYYG